MIFNHQPLPLGDSTHKINKIVQETIQEISYLSSIVENNNHHKGVSGTTIPDSPSLYFSQHEYTAKDSSTASRKSGGLRNSGRDKNQEIYDLILKLGRLKDSINKTLLDNELKMWNFILEFCSIYIPKSFHEHECTVECCSEIPELIHTKLYSSLSLSSLQSSQTGYASRLGKTLDIFYNEEDRKFFQGVIIKNYMSDCDYQYFQRNYVIIISKVNRMFGCFPSGRLHMCHPISERRYETCSRTALICNISGKAYCSFSGLEITNHWAENVFDYNQTFCSEDNIADMTYVESSILSRSSPSSSSSPSFPQPVMMGNNKGGTFSKQQYNNKNNYNVSTISGIHSSGIRLSAKPGSKSLSSSSNDSTTAGTRIGNKRMNGRHFGLDLDNVSTYVSEKVSEIPKTGSSSSSTKFLRTHTSKISKSELSQFRKESSSKTPSRKLLAARFGSSSLPSSTSSSYSSSHHTTATDGDVIDQHHYDTTEHQGAQSAFVIGSDFDIMKPFIDKKPRSSKNKNGPASSYSPPLASSLPSPTLNLSTKGKDHLIRELIEFKRTESRITSAMNNQHNRFKYFTTLRTSYLNPQEHGDSPKTSPTSSSGISISNNNNNNNGTNSKFLYYSHFWQEKGVSYFSTLKKILDSIKYSCLLLYWKRLFLDEIDNFKNQTLGTDNKMDFLLQVLDHKRFDLNLFRKESEKYFSTICLLVPKIYNLRESFKAHESSQGGSSSNNLLGNSNINNNDVYLESTSTKKHSHGSSGYIFSSAKTWNNACFLLGLCSIVKEGIFINNLQIIGGINYPFFPENANKFAITMPDIDREFTETLNRLIQKELSSYSGMNNQSQMEDLKKKTNMISSRIVTVCESLRKIITDIPKDSLFYNMVSTNTKSSKPEYRKKMNKGNKQIRYLLQECHLSGSDLRRLLYDEKLKLDVY